MSRYPFAERVVAFLLLFRAGVRGAQWGWLHRSFGSEDEKG